ncbi:hypothetical protein AYJ57_22060 (plasmid) [Salipiger sp. CCB-MM3]|uniref:hypothetical protein n=1 Tax=Roseobacteraceae TaxID=2854170 RepID=UPI00080AAE9B|nr:MULTISPECIES: hypothetical protein [Roseobacteraceae]ANT63171.1 hypothetical protein AYJ57_22060 [Salipiger sp. CCB-MM3]MCA0994900.1 hypothetical protein [Alloyangia pacifica]
MKKSYIALAALPLIFGAVGYGAGQALAPAAHPQEEQTAEAGPSEAEQILDDLATEAPAHATSPEDGGAIGTPQHNEHADNGAHRETEIKAEAETPPGVLTEDRLGDSSVVTLGKISVPVYRAESITYVVSEVGVAMRDSQTAVTFNVAENASRLRDAILTSMHRAADGPTMKGVNIDTGELSKALSADLKKDFGDDVSEVLFLSLVKADVPRT